MRLIKKMQAVLLLCGFMTAGQAAIAACEKPAELTEAKLQLLKERAAQVPFHRGLLWQVDKDGVTSYIFGTMHLYSPRHSPSMRRLRPLIERVDQVFVEFTKSDMAQLERRLTTDTGLISITQGPSLLERLGPEAWDRLKEALKPYQIPPFMTAKMQPWFLGFTMMTPPCALPDIVAKRPGVDKMIETAADHAGRPVASLDRLDDMLTRLAGDPLDQQVEELRWSLQLELPTSYGNAGLVDFYFSEDVQVIWENAQVELEGISKSLSTEDAQRLQHFVGDMMADLIAGRNHLWMKQLSAELVERSTLVAVGAMHLPGEEGVLRLLEQAGFTVTALSMSQP